MLTWFRDNAKIFLIAIIVTFVVLIFVDWGTGRLRNGSSGLGAVARIDGESVTPEEYDASLMSVYSRIEEGMRAAGHPNPEAELSVMSGMIRDAAFEAMIDGRLRSSYLSGAGWNQPGEAAGEAYIKSILSIMGAEDPETAYRQFTESPGYQIQFLQNLDQMRAMMFPALCRMQNIASRAELDYHITTNYVPVTARFIVFRATPEIPDETQLREFYDSHPELFTYPPNARLRYAVVAIQPDSSDIASAGAVVDSLAMAEAAPDTVVMTTGNLLAFAMIDSMPPIGTTTRHFTGNSMRGGNIPSSHIMRILSVDPFADDPGTGQDTVTALHWESPVLPGRNALYSALDGVNESMDGLLSGEIPFSDSLFIMDWGEMYVEEDAPLPEGMPASVSAFALDTTWVDSIGPVFFSTGYRGGYPALIVAKRLDRNLDTRLVPFEEAQASGELLMTAYSAFAAESSLALARTALDEMAAGGISLGLYAESESLFIGTTPEFTIASVREASLSDPDAYAGLLSSDEFAMAASVAPMLTPIGPFRTGGTAMLAEITSRTELPMPADPAVLAPMYLDVQSRHGTAAVRALLDILRGRATVEDLRAEFEAALRDQRANPSPAPAMPAGY